MKVPWPLGSKRIDYLAKLYLSCWSTADQRQVVGQMRLYARVLREFYASWRVHLPMDAQWLSESHTGHPSLE